MGWCSGTQIFDAVVNALLNEKDKKETIRSLITTLESMDWDCQLDSKYVDHPLVQEVFRELHPRWFREEE